MRTELPPLTLRPRNPTPQQTRALPWVTGLVMLAPLALPLVLLSALPAPHPRTAGEFFSAWLGLLSHAWTGNRGNAVQLGAIYVILGMQLWYWRQSGKRERLILDADGIRYRSAFPASLARFKPDWSLRWAEIRSIRLDAPRLGGAPAIAMLVLDTPAGKKRLSPLQWIDANAPPPRDPRPKLTFVRTTLPSVDDSPLMRYLAAAGIPVEHAETAAFALEKNHRSKAAMAVLFAALAYALGDTFFVLQETYTGSPYWEVYTVAGVLAALASAAWMRRGMVPLAESLGVGLMLGATCGAALYPGLLRINQLTDTRGLHIVEYHSTAPGAYAPLREGRPMLEFDGNAEYWAQFPAGSIYRFELRRGGLGFYQLNLAPIHEDMRRYFEGERNAGAAARK